MSVTILWCFENPAGLTQSVALTNTTTTSDCQTPSGQILGDQPLQWIHRKTLR